MFSSNITSPAASGQLRLNAVIQSAASVIWIHKTTATSVDAGLYLSQVTAGQEIYFQDKDNFTKWQVYRITAPPIISQTNVEYPVTWLRGGVDVPVQRIFLAFDEVSTQQVLSSPFAYPSTSAFGISLGLTKRQFYAAQLATGFVSSGVAANLTGGQLAEWCFKAADSMIQFELSEVTDPALPAGAPRSAQRARNERLKKLQKSQRTP